MKRFLQFDADASANQVHTEATALLRRIPGVRRVEVLEAREGSPRFSVVLDVEDEQDAAVAERIGSIVAMYRGDVWNLTHRSYREVS